MSNIWIEFKKLIPNTKTYIGIVDSINTETETSNITLVSGDSIIVRGTSVNVGNYCIIQNNIIMSGAPSVNTMTTEEIPVLT